MFNLLAVALNIFLLKQETHRLSAQSHINLSEMIQVTATDWKSNEIFNSISFFIYQARRSQLALNKTEYWSFR